MATAELALRRESEVPASTRTGAELALRWAGEAPAPTGLAAGAGGGGCRRGRCLRERGQFVAAEVLVFRSAHFGHGHEGLRVVVVGVPEQEADAALLFRHMHLRLDVFRRVGLGAPGKGLQPWAENDAAALGDQLEAIHRFADEVFGRVAWVRDAVHAE